jgi:hypothetical protein
MTIEKIGYVLEGAGELRQFDPDLYYIKILSLKINEIIDKLEQLEAEHRKRWPKTE